MDNNRITNKEMLNMAETTIPTTKEIKEKLSLIKGDRTYNDLFKEIITATGGAVIDDVVEIKRPQTAFTLESVGYGGNEDDLHSYWGEETIVTFADLSNAEVGDKFHSPDHNYTYSYDEVAEVIFKDKKSVLVRVTSVEYLPTGVKEDVNLLHIMLF